MNRGSACLFILMLLGAVVFSCENDVSKPGGGKEEPACGADLDTINFGKVRIGTFKDSCTTIGAVLSGVHIADTIVIRCPGFHFVDTLSQQTFDTLIYDLTYPDDTTFCIRFEPAEALPTLCAVDRGTDCGDLTLVGTGALPGYYAEMIDFPATLDLYDIHVAINTGLIVCGDSGMVAGCGDFSNWQYVCGGPLTTSPLRGLKVYTIGSFVAILFIGGGGESNGLVFGGCDFINEYQQFEYFTSAFYCTEQDTQFAWLVGRGVDAPEGCNGIIVSMIGEDFFTLSDKTSEISGIDGSGASNVWAVLNQPSENLYHFDGSSWLLMTEGWMIESLHGVWVHESGEAFAVGSNGAIYHYTGSVWEDQSIEFETVTFHDVWGFSPDDVYAVGEHAAIYHYDGVSWWAVPTPPDVDATLYAVHGTDMGGGDVVLLSAGENGTVIGFSPGILRRPTFTGNGVQSSGIISLFDRDLR